MNKGVIVFALILSASSMGLSGSADASSSQPTQQYSKVYLNPFYKNTITNGQDANWTLTLDPPDGFTNTVSAIITFEGLTGVSNNLSLKVNGQNCNTPFFYFSTTYSSSSQMRAYFDCSNVITSPGTYSLTMRPTGANMGATVSWADLVYVNKPLASIFQVGGTEYNINDLNGKVFLQLLDSGKQIITNASCLAQIYWPNSTIRTSYSIMAYAGEGLYFLDTAIPNITGVYMVSGKCLIPNAYNTTSWDNFDCAIAGTCGSGWTGNWVQVSGDCKSFQDGGDNPYTLPYHLKSGGAGCQGYRGINTSGADSCYLTFWAKAKDLGAAENCQYQYYNGTVSTTLLQINDGGDDDTYRFYSYNVCQYGKSSSARVSVSFNQDKCFLDDVNLTQALSLNATQFEKIMGSGEIHVNDWFSNLSVQANVNITAIADSVDSRINSSHGTGLYNATFTGPTLDEIDARLNSSHGNGLWNFTGPSLSEILLGISSAHGTGYYNFTGPFLSDILNGITADHGIGLYNTTFTGPTLDQIDSRINESHGTGLYNFTINVSCPTISEINDTINEHGLGLYNNTFTGPSLSDILNGIDTDHGIGLYNFSANFSAPPTLSDILTGITTDHGAGDYNQTCSAPTLDQIDQRINESHGQGLYNLTTTINVSEIADQVTADHGTGLYNQTEVNVTEITDSVDFRINASHGTDLYNSTYTGPTLEDIDSRLNESHGTGLWNFTINVSCPTISEINNTINEHGLGLYNETCQAPTLDQIDQRINESHGTGFYNSTFTGPTLSDILNGIAANHGTGLFNFTGPFLSDILNGISTDHGAGLYNQTTAVNVTEITDSVDQRISDSHGQGLYNFTGNLTCPSCPSLDAIDQRINESHGSGLYNLTADLSSLPTLSQILSGVTNEHGTGLYNETNITGQLENLTVSLANVTGLIEGIWNYTNKSADMNANALKYVGGTEYIPGETGNLKVQFLRTIAGNPAPMNDADYCNVSVYYPDKTLFISNVSMDFLDSGIYYLNFTVPANLGVYTSSFVCFKSPDIYGYASGSFHSSTGIPPNLVTTANITTSSLDYVGGTEYIPGEIGNLKVQFLQTQSGNPVPINSADYCNVSVYYPNKTLFLANESMEYLTGSNGIYFKNFTVPGELGVYTSDFDCFKTANIYGYTSGSFHVLNESNFTGVCPTLPQILGGVTGDHGTGLYNATATSCPSASAIEQEIASQHGYGDYDWSGPSLTDIDLRLNQSHGTGLWNLTTNVSGAFPTAVEISNQVTADHGPGPYNLSAADVDLVINQSHGTGLYNAGGETPEQKAALPFILGFAAISFILAYISMNLDRKQHGALQVFFAVLSFFFLWATLSASQLVLEVAAVTSFAPLMVGTLSVIIWGGVFFVFYLIIFFLWGFVRALKIKKQEKAADPFRTKGGLA